MVWVGGVLGVEGDNLHNAIVSVYGHDTGLISVCVKCIGHAKCYYRAIGIPGFGIGVEPNP